MLKTLCKIAWNALAAVCLLALVALAVLLIAIRPRPEPKPEPTVEPWRVVLERVEHVNKQVFVEHYNAVDVHYNEAPIRWLEVLVQQDFVVLIRGSVPAGFDLEGLSEEDIWISRDGSRVQLTLPAPQVFEGNVSIDFEKSSVLRNRKTCPSFICRDPLEAYQFVVMPEAKQYLVDFALENGILEQAARDGKAFYEELLGSMGFAEVRVVVTGYDL